MHTTSLFRLQHLSRPPPAHIHRLSFTTVSRSILHPTPFLGVTDPQTPTPPHLTRFPRLPDPRADASAHGRAAVLPGGDDAATHVKSVCQLPVPVAVAAYTALGFIVSGLTDAQQSTRRRVDDGLATYRRPTYNFTPHHASHRSPSLSSFVLGRVYFSVKPCRCRSPDGVIRSTVSSTSRVPFFFLASHVVFFIIF